jgi:hypothetical protein
MRKLIYIMGCAHCGSTLLTTLLGRHSQISTVGELKMTAIPEDPDYLCGCGDRLSECSFWSNVRELCRNQGVDLPFPRLGTHFAGGDWISNKIVGTRVRWGGLERLRVLGTKCWSPADKLVDTVVHRNERIIDAVCSLEGKSAFLDGSKDPVRLLQFIRSGRFDVKVIHLVRDGRAIVASYKKRHADLGYCLMLWKHKAIECERLKELVSGESILTLRYEDLCADVEGTLDKISDFAGVDREGARCLFPSETASSHIIGHASRLQNAREIRLREEWQTILNQQDKMRFAAEDPGLNARHGYRAEGRFL